MGEKRYKRATLKSMLVVMAVMTVTYNIQESNTANPMSGKRILSVQSKLDCIIQITE